MNQWKPGQIFLNCDCSIDFDDLHNKTLKGQSVICPNCRMTTTVVGRILKSDVSDKSIVKLVIGSTIIKKER